MKCPYCKEEIAKNTVKCPVCGENIPKLYSYVDCLKEFICIDKNKKIIKKLLMLVSIFIAIIVIGIFLFWVTVYTIKEINSNKFTDNGYRSIIRHDDYTYAAHSHGSFDELTNKFQPLLEDISKEEKDLMKFFKKSKSIEDNVKLFTIFITNTDKFKEDAQLIYNNSDSNFNDLGIKISEPIENNYNKPIRIITPPIKSFYFLAQDSGYVFFKYDYKYMLDIYAPYLSDEWKEYFTLEYESAKDFKGLDWDNPTSRPILQKWSKKWENFLNKYPDFIYASEYSEFVCELNSY